MFLTPCSADNDDGFVLLLGMEHNHEVDEHQHSLNRHQCETDQEEVVDEHCHHLTNTLKYRENIYTYTPVCVLARYVYIYKCMYIRPVCICTICKSSTESMIMLLLMH